MAQVQHTPGPWELDIDEYGFRIRMGSAVPYTGIYEPQHVIDWDPGVYPSEDQDEEDAEHLQYLEAKANMERIVACVNACEGIPTEALESGVVRELIEAATRLDEIKRLQQKVQRANALAVAVEQALKAWSMGDYLTPFMDDLRDALLDFEEPVASEDGWFEVVTEGEEGGVPDVPERCWYCERELAIESIRVECAHCGADVARAYEWLDALDAARAEAERWRARYEALRETVVGVVLQLTHGMINGQQAEAQLRTVLADVGGGDQ